MSVLVQYLPLGLKRALPLNDGGGFMMPSKQDMLRTAVAVGIFVAGSYFGLYGILAVASLSFPGALLSLGSFALYRGVPPLIYALGKQSLDHFISGLVLTAGAYFILEKYRAWNINGFNGFLEQLKPA